VHKVDILKQDADNQLWMLLRFRSILFSANFFGCPSNSFRAGPQSPNAIKINAEDAELKVLAGAWETLSRFAPVIFLSAHSEQIHRECRKLIRSLGYATTELATDKIWAQKIH
jgi:hypothetical protein